MEYFLTILFNSFKLWEYTDQYGRQQQPEIGTGLLVWAVTFFLVFGIYSIFKKSNESILFVKKGLLCLTVLLCFYGLTLIFSAAGGDLPEKFRFQFILNGLSSLSSNIFWGVFSYLVIIVLEKYLKNNKDESGHKSEFLLD